MIRYITLSGERVSQFIGSQPIRLHVFCSGSSNFRTTTQDEFRRYARENNCKGINFSSPVSDSRPRDRRGRTYDSVA